MKIKIDAAEVVALGQDLSSISWNGPMQDAFDDLGDTLEQRARGKAASVGGAAGLTASTLQSETAFDHLEITASAPYAAGSEYGSSGANPSTRQFANRPGPNKETGHWLGPTLEESGAEIDRRFGDAIDDALRTAF